MGKNPTARRRLAQRTVSADDALVEREISVPGETDRPAKLTISDRPTSGECQASQRKIARDGCDVEDA